MEKNITILLVDDHQLILDAWSMILETIPTYKICATTDDAKKAVDLAMEHRPDIVLMDINIHGGSGFDATQTIVNTLPKTRVIGLSLHDDLAFVKKFISIGAKGYLTKNSSKAELINAVQCVYNDELFICNEIKNRYMELALNPNNLAPQVEMTPKEIDIIKLIASGKTSKQIADELFISARTVDTHRYNIFKKTGVPNSAQLTLWAKNKGYI